MIKFYEGAAITDAWAQATARWIDTADRSAARAYTDALAAAYGNGNVVYAELELDLAEVVFRMAAHAENWSYSQLLDLLWLVPDVPRWLPKLGTIRTDVASHFEPDDVFGLGAFLARTVHHGGAYSSGNAATARSHALGVELAEELMDGEGALALTSTVAWCDFFLDVAWDRTVVVVLPARRRVKLLLATDTD